MGANAQTEVPTFTANQILTAAQMNNSARTGVPVFATTTTRDAAFGGAGEKTLAEGQLAYIEATDVVQYYDGSAWKTIAANVQSATVATSQTTTSTSYVDLATVGPSVTVITGTEALVTVCCTLSNNNNGPATSYMSHAISGATTVAASDVNAIRFMGGVWASGFGSFAKTFRVTGLTAGSNTFTAKYRVTSDTGTFYDRTITVVAL